ncbi:unnamed protein product [Prorocentrum cordatum]|uniref:Uncharacterized protein n=1 Tax=Prorocentrum cordatum TaxID=2364126 RepID=A0ABN9R0Z3_9DINO|nr:unnamed protein product [Polarella glacialis]
MGALATTPSVAASDGMNTETDSSSATQGSAALRLDTDLAAGSETDQLHAIEVDNEDIRKTAAAAATAGPATPTPSPNSSALPTSIPFVEGQLPGDLEDEVLAHFSIVQATP